MPLICHVKYRSSPLGQVTSSLTLCFLSSKCREHSQLGTVGGIKERKVKTNARVRSIPRTIRIIFPAHLNADRSLPDWAAGLVSRWSSELNGSNVMVCTLRFDGFCLYIPEFVGRRVQGCVVSPVTAAGEANGITRTATCSRPSVCQGSPPPFFPCNC